MTTRELPEFLKVPWGVRDVIVVTVAWFGLQIVLGFVLVYLANFWPWAATFLEDARNGDLVAAFVLTVAGILLAFGLVALYLRHYGASWKSVGWRKASIWRTAIYLAVILVVFVVAANAVLIILQALVPGFDANQAQTNEFTEGVDKHRSLALIALVIIPPIFEETIFRGFIFPALSKRGGVVLGAILSSVLFGLAHGQANLFVYTMILGLLLCFMYVRLGSIFPGMLLHMLNNLMAFLALSNN